MPADFTEALLDVKGILSSKQRYPQKCKTDNPKSKHPTIIVDNPAIFKHY
jgi:hypothetical protein